MIPIRFEGVNGYLLVDAEYDDTSAPRPFQIAWGGYWYEQNRRDIDAWVYRQRDGLPYGTLADDPHVTLTPVDVVLTSLVPDTATLGDPSFTLQVLGTGFSGASVIVFAGQDEETTYVSPTEVTTGVNMAVWHGPDPAIPVWVRQGFGQSNTLEFAMEAAAETLATPSTKTAWPMPGWNA